MVVKISTQIREKAHIFEQSNGRLPKYLHLGWSIKNKLIEDELNDQCILGDLPIYCGMEVVTDFANQDALVVSSIE